jgi:uncharacterized protein YhaN
LKLLALDLERMRHFAGGRITFAKSGEPSRLTLIQAPNETGKSTTLEAIRSFLFGFTEERKKAASFLAGGAELTDLRVGAEFEVHGQVYVATRRKGRKDTLDGKLLSGAGDIDSEWLHKKLGNPNRDVFEAVFAFALSDLAQGAESLETDDIKQAIYGVGFGGAVHPQSVLKALKEERNELFSDQGRKQRILTSAATIKALEEQASKKIVRTDAFELLVTQLETKTVAAEGKQRELKTLRALKERARAVLQGVEPWRALATAREELATLVVPSGLGADARAAHRGHLEQRVKDELEHREAVVAEAEASAALAAVQLDSAILSSSADIEALWKHLATHEKAEVDLPNRERELNDIRRTTEARLVAVRPGWTLDRLRTTRVDSATRAELDVAVKANERIDADTRRTESTLERLDIAIAGLEARAQALPAAADAHAARTWLDGWSGFESRRDQAHDAEARIKELERKRDAARLRLDPPFGAALGDAISLAVPPVEEVARFEAELAKNTARREKLEEKLAACQDEIAVAIAELAEIEAGGHAPSEAELASARSRRDEGWKLVLSALNNEARDAGTFDRERPLPRAYEHATSHADEVVDAMRRRADAVQMRAAREATRSRATEQERALLVELRAANDDRARIDAAYAALWSSAGFTPFAPAAMRTWLGHHRELVALAREREDAVAKHESLVARMDLHVANGRRALGIHREDITADELRALAEARNLAELDRVRQATALATELDTSKRERAEAAQQLARLRVEATSWLGGWTKITAALHLEGELSPAAAKRVVDELADLRAALDHETDKLDRIRKLTDDLAAYSARVATTVRANAVELASLPATVGAARLHARLDVARAAEQSRKEHATILVAAQKRRARAERALKDTDGALDRLRAAAGVTTDAAFVEVADRASRASALASTVQENERTLRSLRSMWTEADYFDALKAAVPEALEAEVARFDRDIEALEQDARTTDGEVAVLKTSIAAIDGSAEAAEAQALIESERAALREDIERFSVLAVSVAILEKAIERFEKEHQPGLLAGASLFFSEMTSGRYPKVGQRLDTSLYVLRRTATGTTEVSPEALSTGTKEQLFLALRLAYVQHYATTAEPLPVVLDDVLVNFDDERATATLRALAAFASTTQVLLFTCHDHLIALAERAKIDFVRAEIPKAT